MIRLASIGSGWIVDSFLDGLLQVRGIEHTAVYSRKEETARAFAEKRGVSAIFTDISELAACPDIDAVYVASPNSLHFPQSMALLCGGKHVICEKSVTICREDAETLVSTAAAHGVVFMEAIIPAHLPQMARIKSALCDLGPVRTVRFDFQQYSPKYGRLLEGELPNAFNPAMCTGSLLDIGVYCVYPALQLFGLPKKITAEAQLVKTGADSAGSAVFCYDDMQVVITHSKTGDGRIGSEIVCENGTISIGAISKLENVLLWKRGEETPTVIAGEGDKAENMSWEAKSFVRYITDPAGTAEEYDYMSRLCCDVSGVMREMRRLSGVSFPGDR